MAMTMIIIGTLTIAGLLAAGTYAIATITGWKLTLRICHGPRSRRGTAHRLRSRAPVNDLVTQLVAIRKQRGLSQREVARRMYVTPPLISMFEQGKRPMRTNHLLAYAEAIGARITVEDNS